MKNTIVLSLILVLFISCDKKEAVNYEKMKCINTSVNYGTFKTLKEMEKVAEQIVIVTPLEELAKRENVVRWGKDGGLIDIYSFSKMKVGKVFKGNVEIGQVISVVEPIAIGPSYQGSKEKVIFTSENYNRSLAKVRQHTLKYDYKWLQSDGHVV